MVKYMKKINYGMKNKKRCIGNMYKKNQKLCKN